MVPGLAELIEGGLKLSDWRKVCQSVALESIQIAQTSKRVEVAVWEIRPFRGSGCTLPSFQSSTERRANVD